MPENTTPMTPSKPGLYWIQPRDDYEKSGPTIARVTRRYDLMPHGEGQTFAERLEVRIVLEHKFSVYTVEDALKLYNFICEAQPPKFPQNSKPETKVDSKPEQRTHIQ